MPDHGEIVENIFGFAGCLALLHGCGRLFCEYLWICRALLRMCRALLRIYRALSQICWADLSEWLHVEIILDLRIFWPLLWIYGALLRICKANLSGYLPATSISSPSLHWKMVPLVTGKMSRISSLAKGCATVRSSSRARIWRPPLWHTARSSGRGLTGRERQRKRERERKGEWERECVYMHACVCICTWCEKESKGVMC